MNKLERFHAAVRGAPLDHPPCVAWCNFATDAADGAENARRQLAFHRACDWDILKVMNDYRLAPPQGLETLDGPADMLRFARKPFAVRGLAEQLDCTRRLRDAVGDATPIVETLFEPFFALLFAVGFSRAALIRAHPREAAAMLEALTDACLAHVERLRQVPVDGVLYATNACILPPSSRGIDDDACHVFHRPYDLALLEAMHGMTRIVHAHGNPLDLRRVLDYPCEVLSWSDRLAGNASIREVRALTDKCLMGGIDETRLHERALPEIRAEVADAIAQAGGVRNLIVSPGCNVSPGIAQRVLLGFRDAVRQAGGEAATR